MLHTFVQIIFWSVTLFSMKRSQFPGEADSVCKGRRSASHAQNMFLPEIQDGNASAGVMLGKLRPQKLPLGSCDKVN